MTTMNDWNRWNFEGGDAWDDWKPFTPATLDVVKPKPGAYVIGLPADRSLGRLLAPDVHGIIDVGEGVDLRLRLTALHRCATIKGERGHMAGWRLGSMGLLERLGLRADDLRLSVCYTRSKDDAYRREGAILQTYYALFGELPPLNYKFNWSAWEET